MRVFGRLLLALVVCLIVAVGGPFLMVTALSVGRIWHDPDEAPANDVVLVMGAAVFNGRPSPYLQGRLDLALELWRQGKAKVFIVSGSTSDNEPATMRDYLEEHGVASEDIVLDTRGNDSYASCIRAVETFGVDRLTVVSQSYHVPRTVATCRMVGVDAIGVGEPREYNAQWRSYQRRELAANLKMIYDVVLGRAVGQDEFDPAVQEALARHQ